MSIERNGKETCPSCCLTCVSKPPAIPSCSQNPYALANLLPAGTIHLAVSPDEPSCDHRHGEDGWHPFRGHLMLQQLVSPEDDSLLRELDFLIDHLFISCTCRLGRQRNILHVRVYLTPHDLTNVQGRLRVRDEATVLAPARRYLKVLLHRIVQDDTLWEGDDVPLSHISRSFISQDIDNRTMAQIYSDLPSPRISPDHTVSDLTYSVLSGDEIEGMRTKLYSYQRRSVAAMIQKETQPVDIPDPLFIPIIGIDDSEFYLQPATMEILQERPMVHQNQGGVLCEELGTGKTVMILALVLATLDQLPSPEESILDTRPVMTPLAFRNFPSADFIAARKRVIKRQSVNALMPCPSLVELLLHHIRVSRERLGARLYEEALELHPKLLRLLRYNAPFYHHYEVDPAENLRSRRKQARPGPRLMYLTNASLIIVPSNLVAQWNNEILKHCLSGLRVLVLKSTTQMPQAKVLASNYDIVLMSHLRFAAEASKSSVAKLHSWKVCPCPGVEKSRVPDCRCIPTPEVSPLLQIRWKRLVVDEGHVTSATSTNLTEFSQSISVERRWIVTGTPTTNLLGLSFGRHTEQNEAFDGASEPPSSSASDASPSVPPSNCDESENHTETARRWTADDREDLRKLATMMTHFLKVPHFAANPKLLNHVISPLLDPQGPRPGALQVLIQVMTMIMIRHQIEDVEKDVLLPPIKQEMILLDLDPYAMMSYNCLQATIAINAVDSERTDQDYLFHPRNASSLLLAMTNSSQIMFWRVDDDLYNVDQLTEDRHKHVETAMARGVSPSDLTLLNTSFDHIARAANDTLWRAMQAHEDVPYRVDGMPQPISEAWTRLDLKLGHRDLQYYSQGALPVFMHPDRLIKIRDVVIGRPLISTHDLIHRGSDVDQDDRQRRQLYLEHQKMLKKNKREKDFEGSRGTTMIESVRKAVTPGKMKEVQDELVAAQQRQDADTEEAEGSGTIYRQRSKTNIYAPAENDATKAVLLASSPLASACVGQSVSSKLNYILNDVLQYASEEKFLIFSQSKLTLAHVAEGLELINVKALQFTTQVSAHEREQLVMTFETSETYRVFLMELKHGARGLNLIAASRVIFCEPVWQADVESQAIKRAHRIGQTRPISVKTLVIRSTAEEAMMKRREVLKGRGGKFPGMTEEVGMRYFIENPAFLSESSLVPPLNFALVNTDSALKSKGASSEAVVIADVCAPPSRVRFGEPITDHEPPTKKRKGVRFADEENL